MEGQSVKCDREDTTVYQYTQGQIKFYPSADIAASWNVNWDRNIIIIDCSIVTKGLSWHSILMHLFPFVTIKTVNCVCMWMIQNQIHCSAWKNVQMTLGRDGYWTRMVSSVVVWTTIYAWMMDQNQTFLKSSVWALVMVQNIRSGIMLIRTWKKMTLCLVCKPWMWIPAK